MIDDALLLIEQLMQGIDLAVQYVYVIVALIVVLLLEMQQLLGRGELIMQQGQRLSGRLAR